MNIQYFHTFQTESELFCSLFDDLATTFTAVSAEMPDLTAGLVAPDAILVDSHSSNTWHMPDDHGTRTTCRLLAFSREPARGPVELTQGRFDGRVFLDLSLPPWSVMRHVVDTVARCPRGPAETRQIGLPSTPTLDAIIRGDSVNKHILTLLAFGMSDKEISSSLCLSNQTIRNRMSRMLHDGQIGNRTALAVLFLESKRTAALVNSRAAPMSDPAAEHG